MDASSRLPEELLCEILKNVIPLRKEVHIQYTRDRGPSPYQSLRRLSLVNRRLSDSATRLFYTKTCFVLVTPPGEFGAPADLPIFLGGLRESTISYIQYITIELPTRYNQMRESIGAIEAGLDLLWHFTLTRLTVLVPESPRIRQIETLAEFDKVKEVHFKHVQKVQPKLQSKLSSVKQIVEARKPRTAGQKKKLKMRRLEDRQSTVCFLRLTVYIS